LLPVKSVLETKNPYKIVKFAGDSKLIVLDECQGVKDIGQVLKLLFDTHPDVQIIATGSSSFELKNKINEPLTGRAPDFNLFPFSVKELQQELSNAELVSGIDNFLRFGLYPEIIRYDEDRAKLLLNNLISRYLYKDVLEFESLKKPDLIVKLLQLLAFQIGIELSMNELSVQLGVTRKTVERYLDLLEKCYVIFIFRAFSGNMRNEITKKVKIYFYDTGFCNSVISQYNTIPLRKDVGALWENFCIVEFIKNALNKEVRKNYYFWKNFSESEIDLIEDYDGKQNAFEFKWEKRKVKHPKEFLNHNKVNSYNLITPDNFFEYVS